MEAHHTFRDSSSRVRAAPRGVAYRCLGRRGRGRPRGTAPSAEKVRVLSDTLSNRGLAAGGGLTKEGMRAHERASGRSGHGEGGGFLRLFVRAHQREGEGKVGERKRRQGRGERQRRQREDVRRRERWRG